MTTKLTPDENIQSAMQIALSMASDKGASGADVIGNRSESISFKAAGGKLDEYTISQDQVLGIRVIKHSKVGLAYSESLDPKALEYMVQTAVQNAEFAKADETEQIAVNTSENIEVIDPDLNQQEDLVIDSQIEFALSLESEVLKADSRVRSAPINELSMSQSDLYIANSAGRTCFHTEKTHYCLTSALMSEDGQNALHYHGMIGRKFSDLKVDHVVKQSIYHAAHFLKAKPISSGKYSVVFIPEVLHSLFGNFRSTFSAKSAIEKMNPWGEKRGDLVMDKRLSVTDDPTDKKGLAYTLFDSEGHRTSKLNLVENGVLKNFYHNTATANYYKTTSTGHAARGPKSSLGVSGTNIKIALGPNTDASVKDGKYLHIVAIQGLGSGSDVMSGDFSFAASGYLMNGDKIEQVVKEVTISGNYYDILINNIELVGDKEYATFNKYFFSPLIRFRDLTVSS
jgi:PmbA protein